ncbi:MAG: ABC transporter permease [Actinomycetota bacterium]|nr:ABC transporter permease [Actinomycetota bacterium]
MSTRHAATILGRDIRLSPRSPFVLYALIIPVLLTVLVQGVFGDLFAPQPRLVIADEGSSEISLEAAAGLEGITVTFADNLDEMMAIVEANDADAGLYLPAGFDDEVIAGNQPPLSFFVGGESLASNRIILGITALQLIRGLEGGEPPVDVVVIQLGESGVDIDLRLLPMLMMMVVAVAAAFIPAASLVQEKEDRTLSALLVSPASMADVVGAKGTFGVLLALITGFATLILNDAVLGQAVTHLVILLVAAMMMAEFGLLLGMWAKDASTMFAAWKGGGMLLFFPAVFYIWPNLPQWIARFGPTYYFMDPAFRVVSEGASFGDVAANLAIGGVIIAAIAPIVVLAARRLERTLGAG